MAGKAWWLTAGGVALGVATVVAGYLKFADTSAAPPAAPVKRVAVATKPASPPFTEAELTAFLVAARKAEAIDDPLQRCLAYPEPPGVHWSKAVTSAYCHYLLDPVITLAQARAWIEQGHIAELEAQLARAKQAQLTRSGAPGLFDATYNHIFRDASADTRALIDAWKRQAPDSPYALAASGVAYVAMAQRQRGGAYASQTAQSAFDAMHRLLEQARTDLDRAVVIDPQMTPAYGGMVYAATLDSDEAYADHAAKAALAADPANFPVYMRLVWGSEPKWGGSVAQMRQLVDEAQKHAAQNPLLRLLLSERTGGEESVENCRCDEQAEFQLYRELFDEAPSLNMLMSAGWAAAHRNHIQLSVIYRSELLRFDPSQADHRQSRAFGLIQLGHPEWALTEGEGLVTLSPQDGIAYDLRGRAHQVLGQTAAALADYQHALQLNAADSWAMSHLGDVYINETKEWDKAWDVANRLMQLNPDDPDAWFMRAAIQQAQPRDGLDQTIADFKARFGQNPRMRELVARMDSMKTPHTP